MMFRVRLPPRLKPLSVSVMTSFQFLVLIVESRNLALCYYFMCFTTNSVGLTHVAVPMKTRYQYLRVKACRLIR